jgi:hypothetical protein
MNFKWSWGWGIFTFLMVFVVIMGIFIRFSFQQKIDLVSEEYYPKGVMYENQIEKYRNNHTLPEKFKFFQDEEYVYVQFPNLEKPSKPSGSIELYRPSDSKYDQMLQINVNDTLTHLVPKANMIKGKYIFKIEWSQDSVPYYQEKIIMIR